MLVIKIGDVVLYKDVDYNELRTIRKTLQKYFKYDYESKTWYLNSVDGDIGFLSYFLSRLFDSDELTIKKAIEKEIQWKLKEFSDRVDQELKDLLKRGIFAVAPTTILNDKQKSYANRFFTKRDNLYYLSIDKLLDYLAERNIKRSDLAVRIVKNVMDFCNFKYHQEHIKWLESNIDRLIAKAGDIKSIKTTVVLEDTGSDVIVRFGRLLTSEELARLNNAFTVIYYTSDSMGNLTPHRMKILKYDRVLKAFRIPYFGVKRLEKVARELGFENIVDRIEWVNRKIPEPPKVDIKLHKFQAQALNAWIRNGCRGVIVVPTGGGKTYIGMVAISYLSVPTLVCVTTIELARQWKQKIKEHLGIDVGILGGGQKDIRDVTVAIYNSAVKHLDKIKNKFDFIIFDECLTYDTLVLTDKGWIPIGEIVEKKLPVKVLTHKGRFMPVVGWHKIPLKKRLVKVVLEDGTVVKCTEDHKFLTDRGWVEAIKLSSGEVLYKINGEVVSIGEGKTLSYLWEESCKCETPLEKNSRSELKTKSMPLLFERISEQKCSWRTHSFGSFRYGTKYKVGERETSEEKRPREMERNTQESHGEKRGLEKEDCFNGTSEESYTWDYVRRWSHVLSEQKKQECKAYDKTLFETIRVRYVEILYSEESHKGRTTCRGKQGLWRQSNSVSYDVSSMPNRVIQSNIYQRETDCERKMVGKNNSSDSSCCLVSGQWLYDKKNNKDKSVENVVGGGRNLARMVDGKVGDWIKCISFEEGDGFCNTEGQRRKEIYKYNKTLCNSSDEIQDFVYDITVAEDHSYVANGVVVHNCHHVPADCIKKVIFGCKARKLLGLSATPHRYDRNEALLFFSVGDMVYKARYSDMVKLKLASPLKYYRLYVNLTSEEMDEYAKIEGNSSNNPARIQKLMKIAFSAKEKYEVLKNIVQRLPNDKILVFCQYVEQAEKAYKAIREVAKGEVVLLTGETNAKLRKKYFEQFKEGKKRIIVTTTVLDEGIDVPDAETAIILSGSGTERQMIQRIGRVIRYRPNKVAKVIEIITRNTVEERIADKRCKVLKEYGIKI